MSFNSNPSRVEYVVNTKTTTFTFNFKIFEPENLVVYKIPSGTLPDDETNKLLLNVDYTVSINGDLGGFITLLNTTTIHDIIIIQRTLSIDRVTDFVNNGGIYSDVLNNDQDYQTYLIGDNEIENARHLKLPVTAVGVSSTIPTPIPNRYMLWNPQGTALINDVNAPAWLTDAKGWAINPQDELFTDSTGTIDYSSKHYALYTSGRLDTVQTNGETFESNIDLLSTLDVQISNIGNNVDALLNLSDNILVVSGNVKNIADINTNAVNIDSIITNAANIIDIQNAAENAIIATTQAKKASDIVDYSELRKWESESFRLTAESYAVEPEDIYVKIYTSNGDGTFTVKNTTDYSALHYKAKAFAAATPIDLNRFVSKTSPTGAASLPSGTTLQRPIPVEGMIRYNSETLSFEGYFNGLWQSFGGVNKQYVDTRDNDVAGKLNTRVNDVERQLNTRVNDVERQMNTRVNDVVGQLNTDYYQGPYGIVWDFATDSYIRTGAKGYTAIQSLMRRCVLNVDGSVNYYLHPDNSNFKENGTRSVLTGVDGNVMVEIPKHYIKVESVGNIDSFSISLTPEPGYVLDPAFLKWNGTRMVEVPYRYFRAYEGYVSGGKLLSVSGVTPTRSQKIAFFITQATANGAGWHLTYWNLLNTIKRLCYIEFCDFIVTKYLGKGNNTGDDYGITTGQSNALGNRSSDSTHNNKYMSYRGIENMYADIWEFVDGVNVNNYQFYVNGNYSTFQSDVFTGDYVAKGPLVSAANGLIKRCAVSSDGGFIPTALGGSNTTFYGDTLWTATGARIAIYGGAANNGDAAGPGALGVERASSSSAGNIGAAVCR